MNAPAVQPPLRVAIVAEHASLAFGGEAALPLHWFRVLRKRGVEAWLITHARTHDELRRRLDDLGRSILFVPATWRHRAIWRVGRRLLKQVQDFSRSVVVRAPAVEGAAVGG